MHRNGVGFIVDQEVAKCIKGYWPVSDRVVMMKINAKPMNICIIQAYAPTTDHGDEEVEAFYTEIDQAHQQTKSDDIVIIMGDFNAKIGKGEQGEHIGKYGLGNRNERGERLAEFCQEKNLAIMNTFFKQPARRLYT